MENTRKPKILYVEDDRTLAMLYGMRLEEEGFEVIHCDDGEGALKTVQNLVPDLIVVDLMMPAMDGFKVIELLRATPATAQVRIMVLSALSQPEDIKKARNLGANDYLVKSQVTVDEIVANVRQALGIPTPGITGV